MLELPTELWLRIAHFVPDNDLFHLLSVNRLFFDLATDRRYRRLILDVDRPAALINRLAPIEKDPLIASRVRSLCIHPKAMRSACLRSGKNLKATIKPAEHLHWPKFLRARAERIPLEEDIELAEHILAVISRLETLEELVIEWKQGLSTENAFCFPLLSALWASHGKNLTSVTLDMTLTQLCEMVTNITGLDQVQELALRFTAYNAYDYEEKQAQLAKFINQLALSLQSLSVSSIGHLDVSHLYSNLTYFPHLNHLTLQLPCDPRHTAHAQAFHFFLSTHRNVTHLNFSPQYCCLQSNQPPRSLSLSNGKQVTTADWLEKCFGGVILPKLERLELGLNIFGSGGKRVLPATQHIGRIVRDLRCLSIIGCLISLDDLDLVLSSFVHPSAALKKLVLEVHVLNRDLLDILTVRLPNLEQLHLTYRWVDSPGCTSEKSFIHAMECHTYAHWKLWELQLRCSLHNEDARWPCQKAMIRSIPSLSSKHM